MIKIAAPDFVYQRDVPADCIGVLSAAAEVTIFLQGDESTPEWQALHPPPDPIAEAKAEKRAQIEADRAAQCVADVTAIGHQWQADNPSQALLTKAITMALAGLPLPAVWRSRDNYDMAVDTIGDLLAIAGAMAAQTQTAYATSWARKAMLAAAETIEDIDAV